MKNIWIKTIGVTAAAAVLTVSVCGCSIVKRVHSDLESAYESMDQEAHVVQDGSFASNHALASSDMAVEAGPMEQSATTEAISDSSMSSSQFYDAGVPKEDLKEYEEHGLTYSTINGQWWFGDKPVAVLYDQNHFTMTNGYYMDFGAIIKISRDANDTITKIAELSKEQMSEQIGMGFEKENPEKLARSEGQSFHREDVNVKDMTVKELNDLENQLRVKYRHQDAVIQCNDYIIYTGKDDLLFLSSFCCSDSNQFGVKVSADYDIADEIDITKLDSVEIDYLLLDMLKTETFETPQQLEQAAKQKVAEHYEISEKNLVAISSLI